MINHNWSYYYNLLKKYYSQLKKNGLIQENEMTEILKVIHNSTLGELIEECANLELIKIPSLSGD